MAGELQFGQQVSQQERGGVYLFVVYKYEHRFFIYITPAGRTSKRAGKSYANIQQSQQPEGLAAEKKAVLQKNKRLGMIVPSLYLFSSLMLLATIPHTAARSLHIVFYEGVVVER